MATSRDPGISSPITAAGIEAAITAASLAAVPPGAGEQLATYLHLLLRWNSRLNLTAVREPHQIVRRHFVECVQCAQALPPVETLLDFGSGAGFPGIPIAIVRPEIHVTLGESQGKRAAFLREVIRTLSLNAEVHDGRVENMQAKQTFGAVTLRAVDKMAESLRVATPRLTPGGWLVIFATGSTEAQFDFPDIAWKQRLSTAGLEDGLLLLGKKTNVSRGTSGLDRQP